MITSICMSTRNKAEVLTRTLESIRAQRVPFDYEIVVADDGSTDNTREVCEQYAVNYIYLENPRYRNPAVARNATYRAAKGTIVIAQSDDVMHRTDNVVQYLTESLQAGELLFATVFNMNVGSWTPVDSFPVYSGQARQKPYFFLGSLWRRDIYRIGGNDENFIEPCFDDDWFGDCLINGLGLKPRYTVEAIGWHQAHEHPAGAFNKLEESRQLYLRNRARGDWTNEPWEIV